MKILGIAGRRESGKDTLAAAIKPKLSGFVLISSTTDWPKQILQSCGIPRDCLFGSRKDERLPCGIDGREATRRLITLLRLVDAHCLINRVIKHAADVKADWLIMPCVRNREDVEAIQLAGGRVIRLTRVVYPEDTHQEEVELDHYPHFNAEIDNAHLTKAETCRCALALLREWQWT